MTNRKAARRYSAVDGRAPERLRYRRATPPPGTRPWARRWATAKRCEHWVRSQGRGASSGLLLQSGKSTAVGETANGFPC
jgi:hypothetical protein